MTKARPWPTNAKTARDKAADELVEAVRELRPLVTGELQFDRTEILRRQSAALVAVQSALRLLVLVGADVHVDEELA